MFTERQLGFIVSKNLIFFPRLWLYIFKLRAISVLKYTIFMFFSHF